MAKFERDDFTIAVGKQINDIRKARGLRTMEMGIHLNTTQITVQRHMRGDADLTGRWIAKYADLLGCATDDLIPVQKDGKWVERARQDSNLQPSDPSAESESEAKRLERERREAEALADAA